MSQENKTKIVKKEDENEIKPKDLILNFSFSLEDSEHKYPVNIKQKFVLNSIKEPALINEAENTINNLVELLGIVPFKKMIHSYFSNVLEDYFKPVSNKLDNTSPVKEHIYDNNDVLVIAADEDKSDAKQSTATDTEKVLDVTTIIEPEQEQEE